MDIFTHESNGGRTLTGNNLPNDDQNYVLRAYAHRFTGQHRPTWANDQTPVQFKDDNDWLLNTRFAVDNWGRVLRSVEDCDSRPTFPNNPELRSKNPNPLQSGIHHINPSRPDSETLLIAIQECLPDLEHYARTHGPGPDARLEKLLNILNQIR